MTAATHLAAYDGAGNIYGLASATDGTWTARYEYDPFGEIATAEGTAVALNPFGYATKYRDAETGLLNFGRRCYAPGIGRWISRDPTEEAGGLNLYAAFSNAPANHFDATGERSQPFDWHHNYPQTFRWFFEERGMDIDAKEFGAMLLWEDHQSFKTKFQAEWQAFIDSEAGKKADRKCVMKHFEKVIKPKFAADYKKSVRAEVSHGQWSNMTPADKMKLVAPKYAKLVRAVSILGAIATTAQAAEWVNSGDRAALMVELVNAMEKSGSERDLEVYIWAESHLPGISKVVSGKMVSELSGKPPLSADVANRLRESFLATAEATEP